MKNLFVGYITKHPIVLWRYFWKLMRHKWFVLLSARKCGCSLWLALIHDWSKFLPSEYIPYALSFCGPWEYSNRPRGVKLAFDIAWLHHQKRNKHHWQYWVLQNDNDGTYPLPMPEKYLREMLADWHGAGLAYGNPNTREWYDNNRGNIILDTWTRGYVDDFFGEAKT